MPVAFGGVVGLVHQQLLEPAGYSGRKLGSPPQDVESDPHRVLEAEQAGSPE